MADLKTVSQRIKRPLLVAFSLSIPVFFVLNLFGSKRALPPQETGYVTYTAVVRDKTFDANGDLKSFTAGRALCRVDGPEIFEPVIGSTVTITGKLSLFDRPFNKGGFDPYAYYLARGTDLSIRPGTVKETVPARFTVREQLCRLRRHLAMQVRRYCKLESGTINTLLLADKSGLDPERKDLYKSVSLAHFLVVSGLHVSALAGAVFRRCKALLRHRTPACAVTIVLLVAYGMLIDFGVSVTRAIIMYSVRLVAAATGESYDMLSAASLAALLTLTVNPLLLTDPSFIYSYTAVFGIGFLYETGILTGLKGVRERIRDALRFSFAMCLIMLPVTLKLSGTYTLGAILLNLFIIPFCPLMLGDGFLALAASVTGAGGAAAVFDNIEYLLLKMTDSFASVLITAGPLRLSGEPSFPLILLYYAGLMIYAFRLRKTCGRLQGVMILTCLMQAVSAVWWWNPVVSMLYVGQGECIVIRTGPRTAVISDCGSTSKAGVWEYDLEPFLDASGINRIEGFMLSHSDRDHSSGLTEYMEGYKRTGISVDKIILQRLKPADQRYGSKAGSSADPRLKNNSGNSADPRLDQIKEKASGLGIGVYNIARGDTMRFGGWNMECLWPDPTAAMTDVNADSLVLSASYGRFTMLFTGDISSVTEEKLPAGKVRADVLKIPHHGSKTASSEGFLRAVAPRLAVISAGIGNVYHHPSPVVTERLDLEGIPWLCTKDTGEIDIIICPAGFFHRGSFKAVTMRDRFTYDR